jgi:hypothetical protein
MMEKKPNFFIVGAPKCGTTSLCKYLEQHPDIFISELKEPNYFSYDLATKRRRSRMSITEYLNLFRTANTKAIGEGSTQYLYSKVAAKEIHKFNPEAKIIIMLRNPADFLYSYHNQCLLTLAEDIKDFELALKAETDRKKGLRIPQECTGEVNLYYSEVAKFSEQVQRYLELFSKEHVYIIIFDDFKQDTAKIYRQLLRFLEVDETFNANFEIYNSRKKVKNMTTYKLFVNFKWWVHKIGRKSKKIPFYEFIRKLTLSFIYNDYLNQKIFKTVESSKIPPQFKKELTAQFTPEIERLSKLIDRDLTHWKLIK